MKSKESFCILSLLVAVLLSTGNCEHENHHSHHSNDDNRPNFVSQIKFLWKSTTVSPTANELDESQNKGHHESSQAVEITTQLIMQNGTFGEDVKNAFRASLALVIGAPIFGVLFLCCCCYCCCKCCGICCEDEEKGQVIVMQQNNAPAPVAQPPTHIIVQQPVYQTPYVMQPPPQWSPPPQAQQFANANAAYDNPNYGAPSAPPQYVQKY